MRPSVQRKNSQDGTVKTSNGTFATYANLQRATDDILQYMNAKDFPVDTDTETPTLSTFVAILGSKGYYGEESTESYLKKVQSWQNR